MTALTVFVDGTPAPQGSMKAFAVRRAGEYTGQVNVTSDNPGTRPWRDTVRAAVMAERQRRHLSPVGGPVAVHLFFYLHRPKHHYGTGRNAGGLKPSAPAFPAVKRDDIDKLSRAVLDALTAAGAYVDDGQVVRLSAAKFFADGRPPGCIITISTEE